MKTAFVPFGAAALGALLFLGFRTSAAAQEEREEARQEKASEWIEQLGADDLEIRERAWESLLDRGRDVLPDLDRAAREAKDPEVRWNARLLAGQIRRSPEARRPGRRAPTAEAFRFDFDRDGLFRELEEMQRRMEEFSRRFEEPFRSGPPLSGKVDRRGSSVRVEKGPDGKVKAEVTESRDGEEETKTYEADSWEEFRGNYPEVVEKYGLDGSGPGLSLRMNPFGGGGTWFDPSPFSSPGGPPAAERLGVYFHAATEDESKEAGVEKGVGLVVEEVEQGTLAETMKVQPGDILLEIGDEPIRGPETIRRVLKASGKGKTVTVEVFREGEGKVSLSAAKRRPRISPREL